MLRIYRELAGDCWTQKQAYEKVVRHRASSFYILPHTAYNALRKVFKGMQSDVRCHTENDRRKYRDIYARIVERSAEPEYAGMSLRELCEVVVREPAPEFYLNPSTFSRILADARKEKRRRLRHENRRE